MKSLPRDTRGSGSDVKDACIALVVSSYHNSITDSLKDGALAALKQTGLNMERQVVLTVPGAFEIPIAAQKAAKTLKFDAIICLGCLIRGETPHFEYIASAVANGVMQSSQDTNIPMTFGILTTNTKEEALARTGPEESNKGWEAANAAIELIRTFRTINSIDIGVSNKT